MADQLLQEPVHLVGHSYGAIVAMLAAERRPESVQSLTVIEPPAAGVAAGNPAVDEWAGAMRALFADPGDDMAALLRRFFDLQGAEVPVPTPLPEPLERGARALASARSPTAQRAVIEGAGHLVPNTGDPFNRRLEEFLLESS